MSEELSEKVQRYRLLTEAALQRVSVKAKEGSKDFARAKDFLSMARNYFNDARHFEEQRSLIWPLLPTRTHTPGWTPA